MRCPSSLTFHIFDFSSETAKQYLTKLDRKQDLNVLYQIFVFRADRKNKMAALASDWLRHFRLLLWNHWTEFNKTWQEARSQRPLQRLCFSGRSEKTRWPPWPLIGWDIFDFSSETAEQNSTKLDRKQDLNVLYQVCGFFFFGPIRKTRWPPWSLIGRDIFDFSSVTAKRNSTKLDRKQDLNVLYQVCVFRADRKNKMAALASDWLRHFRLLLWNHWTEFNKTWQEARSQRPLQRLCFSGRSEKTRWPPWPLIGWDIFDFSSETAEQNSTKLDRKQDLNVLYQVCGFFFFGPIRKTRWPPWSLIGRDIFDFSSVTAKRNSTKLDRKQDLNVLYQVCVFRADRKNKMAALATDWLRHFRLLIWNHWTEFNETWQEARSQRPLPSLCFSGRSKKKTRWPPCPLIGWDIFDFSSETAEWNITKLDKKQDLNVLFQVCVFRADQKNKMAALASDWWKHFRLLLWNHWTEFDETWQEDLNVLYQYCVFSGQSEK